MHKLLKNILILVLLSSAIQANDSSTMIHAINQQKVLLQQILKEYAFLGMENHFKNSTKKLETHLKEYTVNFALLEANLKSKDAKVPLKKSHILWSSLKEYFQTTPSKEKVLTLQKETDKLLQLLSILMKTVLTETKNSSSNIVSIAGYQGVIIERMAALYMIKTWGISDPKFNFKMRESITFFNNSLYKMLESPETSPSNQKAVKKVMRSFKFFEIMNRSKTKFIPTLIYSKTSNIHKQIQKITQTYIEKGK
ncbi:MAG: hypothetical protein Q9M36_04105 [Sulfurovum sp.]|nr:hypothetical protein [Sulfurovum sp.]